MPKEKQIVCCCEDVTKEDVLRCIKEGATDVRDLRMKTGVGTGPCQGKYCVDILVRILAEYLGKPVEEVGTPTSRPPLTEVTLGDLKGGNRDE